MRKWLLRISYILLTLLALALLVGFTYEQVGRARDASELPPRIAGGASVLGESVSGTLSPPRGLGAAIWAVARPYQEPRRWPVRVQPFPLGLSPGFFSGEPTWELHVTEMPGPRSWREARLARR